MKFVVLIYNDPDLVDTLPASDYDTMMRGCIEYADRMRGEGRLLESRMLTDPRTAKSIRVRNGRATTFDGPFAEAKEVLGGFNLIEAADMDEALEMASHFPWASTGCVEVRAVEDFDAVRRRVGAPPATEMAAAS